MLIYLACPYTHTDARIERLRAEIATRVAVAILLRGESVFSPLSHSMEICRASDGTVAGDYSRWQELSRRVLHVCDELHILKLPGWRESTGVEDECRQAIKRGIRREFLEAPTWALEELADRDSRL